MNQHHQITEDEAMTEIKWSEANSDLIFHGHTETIAKLLESKEKIPEDTRHLLAAYLRGEIRTPDMRGKKNSTLTPSEKEWIHDAIKFLYSRTEIILLHTETIAEDQANEPNDIRKQIESIRRANALDVAEIHPDHKGLAHDVLI